MAAFDAGTGGDLTATSLEGAILETAARVDASERSQINAEGFTPALTLTLSVDDQTATISYTPPVSNTVSADGSINVSVDDYLGSSINGGGGDLGAVTDASALMELIQRAANAEDGTDDNNATVSYDLENNLADAQVTLPVTITASGSDGNLAVAAVPYLA